MTLLFPTCTETLNQLFLFFKEFIMFIYLFICLSSVCTAHAAATIADLQAQLAAAQLANAQQAGWLLL